MRTTIVCCRAPLPALAYFLQVRRNFVARGNRFFAFQGARRMKECVGA